MVVEAGVASYMFSHALVRSALFDDLAQRVVAPAPPRGRGAASRDEADLDAHLGELAYHYVWSIGTGDVDKAVEYSRRAGYRALAQLAHDEAVSWFQQARELIVEGRGDPAQLGGVLVGLGTAEKFAGIPSFRETLLAAADWAEKEGDAELLAAAALVNQRGFWSTYGEVDVERADVSRRAIAALSPAMRAERAKLLEIWRSRSCSATASRPAGRSPTRPSRSHATSATTRPSLTCWWRASAALWDLSTLSERLAHGEELAGLTEAIGDPHLAYFANWFRFAALVEAGRVAEADEILAVCSELAGGLAQGIPVWSDSFTRGGPGTAAGRLGRGRGAQPGAVRARRAPRARRRAAVLRSPPHGVALRPGRCRRSRTCSKSPAPAQTYRTVGRSVGPDPVHPRS